MSNPARFTVPAVITLCVLSWTSGARAEEQPAPGAKSSERSKTPAYIALGVAGTGLVVGSIFGLSALRAKDEFEQNPTAENADKADSKALVADISFAAALASAAVGGVLLLTNSAETPARGAALRRPRARGFVLPVAGTRGGGLVGGMTF